MKRTLLSICAALALILSAGAVYACSCAAGPNGIPAACEQASADCDEDEHAGCNCQATVNTCRCVPD